MTKKNTNTPFKSNTQLNIGSLIGSLFTSENASPDLLKSLLDYQSKSDTMDLKKLFLNALRDFQRKHGVLESENVVKYKNGRTGEESEFVMPTINHLKAHILEHAGSYGLLFTTAISQPDPEDPGRYSVEVTLAHIDGYTKTYTRDCKVHLPAQIDFESEASAAISKCEKSILLKAFGISIKNIAANKEGSLGFQEDFFVEYPITTDHPGPESFSPALATVSKLEKSTNSIVNKINKVAAKEGVRIDALISHLKIKGIIRKDLTEIGTDDCLEQVLSEVINLKNTSAIKKA